MLFTIVKDGEIKGLLYLGEEVPEGMADTVKAVPVLGLLGSMTLTKGVELQEALEDQVTLVHSDNPSIRVLVEQLGYGLFRCRDMNTGGDI